MITAAHVTVFAHDAEAARAFFRDILGLPCVDPGGGWLTFAVPPTELAFHPGAGWGRAEGQHMLFLMCDDIERTVEDLGSKGVEFVEPIADEGFGPMTRLRVPGAGEMGLYQPTYASPVAGSPPA
jgi:catechol 2,3-dioxygenase-like lactoylglutathione lyase family enzyme